MVREGKVNFIYHITLLFSGLAGLTLLYFKGYNTSFLLLNQTRFQFFDYLLVHLTHLGDPLVLGGLCALTVSRFEKKQILKIILAMILAGIVVQILKNTLFVQWHRPLTVFQNEEVHFFPDMVEYYHSFPSGHSATAVAGFTVLATLKFFRPTFNSLILVTLAVLTCYSRVYLGVHFLGDILAGALIGYCFAIFIKLPNRFLLIHINFIRLLGAVSLVAGIINRYF